MYYTLNAVKLPFTIQVICPQLNIIFNILHTATSYDISIKTMTRRRNANEVHSIWDPVAV